MFWYAKIMKVLPAGKWYYPLILAGILWIASLPGKLVTLFQEADRQFLFTQDDAVKDYLDEMRGYSRLLPAILIGITAAILYPFASLKVGLNGSNYLFWSWPFIGVKWLSSKWSVKNLPLTTG